MWLDYKDFEDYEKLYDLIKLGQEIVINPDGTPFDIKQIPKEFKQFIAEDSNEIDWESLTIYQKIPSIDIIAHKIDSRYELLRQKLSEIPSITQAVINWIGPNSVTPYHCDNQVYNTDIATNTGVQASNVLGDTYQIMLGLYIPQFDNMEIGLMFKHSPEDQRTWRSGEIIAFDGSYEHSGWNKTNEVRISLFIDVVQNSWKK
jgi:hypothetical protein